MMHFDEDGEPVPGPGKRRIVHHGYPGLTKAQAGCFCALFAVVIGLAYFAVVTSDDNPYPDQSSPPSLTIEDYMTVDARSDATAQAEVQALVEGVENMLATNTPEPTSTPYPYDPNLPFCVEVPMDYRRVSYPECNMGTPIPEPPSPVVTYATPQATPLTDASPTATVVTTDRNSHD